MPIGMTPARGDWEYILSDVTSLAGGQFQKGDLVSLGFGRLASLYTSSNMTVAYGIAMGDSLDSFPAGKQLIAVAKPGCTAYVDTLTAEVRSNLSFGEAGSIVSAGGRTSTFSKLATSVWSRCVEVRSWGGSHSADSRIEVAFIQNVAAIYSTSSNSFLA